MFVLSIPAGALELTAPEVPGVEPSEPASFSEDLLEILQDALENFRPDLREAGAACVAVIGAVMALSVPSSLPGKTKGTVELAGAVMIAAILLEPAHSLVTLGVDTVAQLSEYEKLLLPVLTAALAAQGGINASAALYAGTAAFNAVLSSLVSRVLAPMLYVYLALAVAHGAVGDDLLKKLRDFEIGRAHV